MPRPGRVDATDRSQSSGRIGAVGGTEELAAPLAAVVMVVLVGFFLVLKAYALPVHTSDEGIYFYGALRWSQGVWPYRDFFFAHPPLHLAPLALLFRIAGYHLTLAKSVPFLAAAAQGVCVWLCVRRAAADVRPAVREPAALAAAASLLFAESVLKASSHATGINQASALLAVAATLVLHRRPAAAGFTAGAAVMTLLQAAPAVAVLGTAPLAAAWFGRDRVDARSGSRTGDIRAALRDSGAIRFAAAFLTIVGLLHLGFLLVAGGRFFGQVYAYHLGKIDRPGEGWRQLGFIVVDNWLLFSGAAVGIGTAIAAGVGRRGVALAAGAIIVLQLGAMASRPRVFPFYFQPAFFPAAVGLGLGIVIVVSSLLGRPGTPPRTGPSRGGVSLSTAAGVGVLASLLGLTPVGHPLVDVISPRRAEQRRTYAQSYAWSEAPGIGRINRLVRSLFWQEGQRVAGHDYNAVTQYLWQRSRSLDVHQALVEAVKLLARDRPGAVLFGDSTTAPQVAIDAGVRIAGDLVDTNIERLRSGQLPFADVEALLARTPDVYLLLSPGEGIGSLPEMRAHAAAHFTPAAEFTTRLGGSYVIYKRR